MTDPNELANETERFIEILRDNDMYESARLFVDVTAYLRSLTTINPRSGLPQTPDQVRTERDMLLMSQDALLQLCKRFRSLARGRLDRLHKLRLRIGS